MTAPLRPAGHPRARLAARPAEVRAAQGLRHDLFVTARGLPPRPGGLDADRHDPLCRHLLVEEGGRLVGTARVRLFADGRALPGSYAAESHDLSRLLAFPAPLLEVGRFCATPGAPGALRAAWGLLTALVDAEGVGLLFGCASFEGADPARHAPALAYLAAHHPPPPGWALPGPAAAPPDRASALRALPPILRAYLAMGGWVAGPAVADPALDTLHVLTVLPVAAVPPARARALRALALEVAAHGP